jgi:hypothetical protein
LHDVKGFQGRLCYHDRRDGKFVVGWPRKVRCSRAGTVRRAVRQAVPRS